MATKKRDTSRALELAKLLRSELHRYDHLPSEGAAADELVQILTDMDARTGKRDPTKRVKR